MKSTATEHRDLSVKQLADECKAHGWEQIMHGPDDGYTRRYNARDRLDAKGVKPSKAEGKVGGVIVKTDDGMFLAVEMAKPGKTTPAPKGDAKSTGRALKDAFPLDVCRRLLELQHERLDAESALSDLKRDRKELKAEITETEGEIDKTIADEEAEGRGSNGAGFSADASKKLVGLRRDVDRRAKRLDGLEDRIADTRDRVRNAREETDRTISQQDPTDNLFASVAAQTEPVDDKPKKSKKKTTKKKAAKSK